MESSSSTIMEAANSKLSLNLSQIVIPVPNIPSNISPFKEYNPITAILRRSDDLAELAVSSNADIGLGCPEKKRQKFFRFNRSSRVSPSESSLEDFESTLLSVNDSSSSFEGRMPRNRARTRNRFLTFTTSGTILLTKFRQNWKCQVQPIGKRGIEDYAELPRRKSSVVSKSSTKSCDNNNNADARKLVVPNFRRKSSPTLALHNSSSSSRFQFTNKEIIHFKGNSSDNFPILPPNGSNVSSDKIENELTPVVVALDTNGYIIIEIESPSTEEVTEKSKSDVSVNSVLIPKSSEKSVNSEATEEIAPENPEIEESQKPNIRFYPRGSSSCPQLDNKISENVGSSLSSVSKFRKWFGSMVRIIPNFRRVKSEQFDRVDSSLIFAPPSEFLDDRRNFLSQVLGKLNSLAFTKRESRRIFKSEEEIQEDLENISSMNFAMPKSSRSGLRLLSSLYSDIGTDSMLDSSSSDESVLNSDTDRTSKKKFEKITTKPSILCEINFEGNKLSNTESCTPQLSQIDLNEFKTSVRTRPGDLDFFPISINSSYELRISDEPSETILSPGFSQTMKKFFSQNVQRFQSSIRVTWAKFRNWVSELRRNRTQEMQEVSPIQKICLRRRHKYVKLRTEYLDYVLVSGTRKRKAIPRNLRINHEKKMRFLARAQQRRISLASTLKKFSKKSYCVAELKPKSGTRKNSRFTDNSAKPRKIRIRMAS